MRFVFQNWRRYGRGKKWKPRVERRADGTTRNCERILSAMHATCRKDDWSRWEKLPKESDVDICKEREREREFQKGFFLSFLFSLSTKHSNASSNLGMERPLRRKMCIIMSAKIFVPKEKMNRWLLLCRILWIQKCSPNICALVSDAWSIQKPVSDITSVIYTRTGREWILASKMWLRSTGKTIGMRYKNNNKKEKKKKKKENAFTGQYQTT